MKIMIYGSCISRDTLELSPHPDFELVGYYARSSMISAFSSVKTKLGPAAGVVASSFQRRMLEADAGKSLAAILKSKDLDVLLVDIVDERFHVWALGEERLTDSPACRETRFLDRKAGWRLMTSGTDEHFVEWTRSVDRLLRILDELPGKVRLVFLNADWASTIAGSSDHGDLRHGGQTPAESNLLYSRYRDYLRDKLPPDNVIQPPDEVTVADPNHKWGLAPFHYVPEFYQYVSRSLAAMLSNYAD